MGYRHRVKHYLHDEQIYNFYIKNFVIGKKLHSPFRYDPGPSFYTKYTDEGHLIWIDYGAYQENYDAIGFVSCLYEVGREGAARKIFEDIINKGIFPSFPQEIVSTRLPEVIITQPLRDFELEVWAEFLITRKTLEHFNIHSLKGRYIKDELVWVSTVELPMYVYKFDEQNVKARKIYNPKDKKKNKFRGMENGSIIEGYGQLPLEGDLLIVTSSLKDVATLYTAGYNAVAPPSETNIMPVLDKTEELDSRFDKVIILFDNDEAGIREANNIQRETGWKHTHMRTSKDPSDYVKNKKDHLEIIQVVQEIT